MNNGQWMTLVNQGGRGYWAVYYTSPQGLIIMFSYSLAYQPWGLLLNFDWLVHLGKSKRFHH